MNAPTKPSQLEVVRTVFRYGKNSDPKPGTRYVIELGPGQFYVEEWHSGKGSPYRVAGPIDEPMALAVLSAHHPTELPHTIGEWKALPELPSGRYLVVNVGYKEASLIECRAANVEGLPPPEGDESDCGIRLPNITVQEGSTARVYRLHVDFGSIAKAMFDHAGQLYARGQNLLPMYCTFGMNSEGAFAIPDNVR